MALGVCPLQNHNKPKFMSTNNNYTKFIPEYRKTSFKDKDRFTSHELKKRNVKHQVELRKRKRDELIAQKRAYVPNMSEPESDSDTDYSLSQEQSIILETVMTNQLEEVLPLYVEKIHSNDLQLQLEGLIGIRKLISKKRNQTIQAIIDTGIIPRLINFLDISNSDMLQLEASTICMKITTGTIEQTQALAEASIMPNLLDLVLQSNVNIQKQAFMIIGNICTDVPSIRSYILVNEARILNILKVFQNDDISLIQIAVCALCKIFCNIKNVKVPMRAVELILPILVDLIDCSELDIIEDACWTLSYLLNVDGLIKTATFQNHCIKRLLKLLTVSTKVTFQLPILYCLRRFCSNSNSIGDLLISEGFLLIIKSLLNQRNVHRLIEKELCSFIADITEDNEAHTMAIILEDLVPEFTKILSSAPYKTKTEVCFILSNITNIADSSLVSYLISNNCIKSLCQFLEIANNEDVRIILVTLKNILDIINSSRMTNGLPMSLISELITDPKTISALFNCSQSDNEEISTRAVNLIEKYFSNNFLEEL
ncbi:uncharacterized protein NDAI_0H03780 [Naumovozyma dairenensis CBS 421]|uniref:Importin subunit alpha n=1 Tax=Naumovozyma dairenensis (strain ATCC 10597 / BCRC 20456 / CBS 421 / NBRC 0211 / NRRL Y-12639) TaxID=1071378 RepID=G0WFJ0_NAUDC|nr:hypothetical protein NDAI_0H03780 [Naumovozyma dairenensis CBS 421]CCD26551.1 hypothetical protein NDAI_0H03780 [Naumovozyma dairenensis CBS 421]